MRGRRGSAAVRDAEAVLNEFRQQLRTDLRSQAARGVLPADVVPLLKGELDRVRRASLEALEPPLTAWRPQNGFQKEYSECSSGSQ